MSVRALITTHKPMCSANLHVVVLERTAQKSLAAHTRMRVSQRASRCQEPCGDPSACSIDIIACVRGVCVQSTERTEGRQMELYPKQLQGTQAAINLCTQPQAVSSSSPDMTLRAHGCPQPTRTTTLRPAASVCGLCGRVDHDAATDPHSASSVGPSQG